MASPTIAAEAIDGETAADATSHVLNLPTGISAGDLLVEVFVVDGFPVVTWPGGWTPVVADVNGGAVTVEIRARVATGSEGATITLGTNSAQKSQGWSFRVPAAEWFGTLATGLFGAITTGTSTTPDSPNLAPAPGSLDWLFIAGWGNDNANRTFSGTYPTNYTNGAYTNLSDAFGVGLGRSRRALTAASDNPAAASALSVSDEWVAYTLAIRPSAGGGTPQELAASGNTATSGAASLSTPKRLAASGDTLTGGSAEISGGVLLAAVGLTLVAGAAALATPKLLSAVGNTLTGGRASLTVGVVVAGLARLRTLLGVGQ